MFSLFDIEKALSRESSTSITKMVAITWHHQWRARLRVPDVIDEWQSLMDRWLTLFDSHDAARLIELIIQHRLKDGDLPVDYDPEYAERMCQALARSRDEFEDRSMMRDIGLPGSIDTSLGTMVNMHR